MRKEIVVAASVIALASLLVGGATMAWFTDRDDAGLAEFTSGTLSIEAGTSMIFGVEAVSGDLYEIDLSNGSTYLLYDKTIGTTADKYVNALAYDRVNKRLYYTPYQNDLYFYDFTGEVYAGKLAGARTAGATFGRGFYWYVPQGSNDLRRVDFNADGTVKSDTMFMADFAGGSYSFGDVAMDISDNMIYGSASASSKVYFKIDLLTKTYTQIDIGFPNHMQVSFGSDGALYGHVTDGSGSTGTSLGWYKIDLLTGDATALSWSPGDRNFNDLASNFQNNWNPDDTERLHYYVKNTGSKYMNLRVLLNGNWLMDGLSADNVTIGLADTMFESDWIIDGQSLYYLQSVAPGEMVSIQLIIHLDGMSTDDTYQGQTFMVQPIFDAIQASNFAPYHEWGVNYYGTP